MKLGTLRRPRGSDEPAPDPARAEHERQVRQARLELARRQAAWTEIPEPQLVVRARFLVDAETDLIYTRRRGVVWEPGKAAVGYVPDGTPMAYFVDAAGDIMFLEQPGTPRLWSEHVARRTRRGAAG